MYLNRGVNLLVNLLTALNVTRSKRVTILLAALSMATRGNPCSP